MLIGKRRLSFLGWVTPNEFGEAYPLIVEKKDEGVAGDIVFTLLSFSSSFYQKKVGLGKRPSNFNTMLIIFD